MKLKVNSLRGLYELVKSVKSIANGALFVINENGCVVKSINESKSIRAFFRTNVWVAQTDEDDSVIRLPILDLAKLLQAIKVTIETSGEVDTAEFNITKQFISHTGRAKFKLKLSSEAHLMFYTTEDLKTATTDMFTTDITNDNFRYVMKYKSITGDKDPKIYIFLKDGIVYCEHDDKTQNLVDSLGMEVSKTFTGSLSAPICININNNFSKFNPLGADKIQIALQELNGKPAFVKIRSRRDFENSVIAVELVSKILEK